MEPAKSIFARSSTFHVETLERLRALMKVNLTFPCHSTLGALAYLGFLRRFSRFGVSVGHSMPCCLGSHASELLTLAHVQELPATNICLCVRVCECVVPALLYP